MSLLSELPHDMLPPERTLSQGCSMQVIACGIGVTPTQKLQQRVGSDRPHYKPQRPRTIGCLRTACLRTTLQVSVTPGVLGPKRYTWCTAHAVSVHWLAAATCNAQSQHKNMQDTDMQHTHKILNTLKQQRNRQRTGTRDAFIHAPCALRK
jgi:hypothetical protein